MPPLLDRFLFEITGVSEQLRVVRFAGREGISELFHFEVVVAAEGEVSATDAVGKTALLSFKTDQGAMRYVHGVVSRFACGDAGKKLTMYHVTLVPKVWRLTLRRDCRIFQEKTAPQIIEEVLKAAGLATTDFRLSLQSSYEQREYCVQYRESDFAFICRLMEEEGIFYFFEHTDSKHVLVLGDKPSAFTPIAGESTIVFKPPLGALSEGEHVSRIRYSEEVRPGSTYLRDYDFKKPTMIMEGKTLGTDADADLELYDHPGDFDAPSIGTALSKIRLEEARVLKKRADGDSACRRLMAGYKFTLSEHTREALNQEWLITHVEHRGAEPLGVESSATVTEPYENHFEVIPASVPFRPPMNTPRPTIRGVQSAFVVGPPGEEIHTDEHGRVKVHFHWDRVGKKDDKDSCWIRVSQVWAGKAWGAMHIPRVGQEVLVDFMDGDPDRPIIMGRVYHSTNVPPYPLPANKTKSTSKSDSTPYGGGSNELAFEDKKGSEEVYLHGQKDWTILIENDKNQVVGHDETREVKHDRTLKTGNDQKETIVHDETFDVGNNRTKTVGNDEKETIKHDRTISVTNDHTESIGNNMTLSVTRTLAADIGENATEKTGLAKTLTVGTDYTVDVSGDRTTTVGGKHTEEVKLEKAVTVGEKLTITVGAAVVTVEKNGNITIEGATLEVKATADVKVTATGKVEVKATGDVNVESSGKVTVKSSGATSVEASGMIKVKGSQVGIN